MEFRSVWPIVVACTVGALAATASCSAPDPGEVTFSERRSGSSGDTASGGASPAPSSSSTTDGGGTTTPQGDPVFGTTTFTAGTPSTGAPANAASANHAGSVEGKDCFQSGCHGSAGPAWAFGATVYSAATGGPTVSGAEVRVTGPDGTEYAHAYTDENGNVWIDKPLSGDIPANSRAGVRNGTSVKTMVGTIGGASGAACNNVACHGSAAQKLYLN